MIAHAIPTLSFSISQGLNLLPSVDITSDSVERAFIFPGANPHDYATVRNHILCRFRQDPNFFLSVEHAGTWFRSKHRNLVHCAHRFLTTAGFINFGVGFTTSYLNDTTRSGWGATKVRPGAFPKSNATVSAALL